MAFLEIRDVHKEFGAVRVLRGVNLSVDEHQVVCLIGASGCGKSTLLRCINGLEPIQGGEIRLMDDRVSGPGVDVNRLRRDVIPRWLAAEPDRDVLAGVSRSRDQLEEDAEALAEWAAGVAVSPERGVRLADLSDLPMAVARRVLHRWRMSLGARWGDVSRQTFEAVLTAARSGVATRLSLGPAGFARVEQGWLRFESAGEKAAKLRKATWAN